MPLTPALPAPLLKYSKWLIKGLAEGYALLESLSEFSAQPDALDDLEWRYVVLRFQRPTPSTTQEDYAQIGLNLINITGGDVDTSWTTGDYTTAEGFLDEWWTTVKAQIEADHKLVDYRWYRRQFNPVPDPNHRFLSSGPPQRITVKNSAGTKVAGLLPPQAAMSITLKTAVPKHWGRFYMPGLSAAAIDGWGRWTSATMTAMANATAELVDDLQGADLQPVVAVTQVDKVLRPALLGVTSVQVDDVPDVIRRRRPRQAAVRTIGAPTP